MNNQNFDPFSTSDSPSQSSNNSTATSHLPGFGTSYNPATQSQPFQPQSSHFQQPNSFAGCYRPQLPNQDYPYFQQQIWNPHTYHQQQQFSPQNPFPPQQPFPQQPFPQQQIFSTPQFCTQPTPTQPPSPSSPPSSSRNPKGSSSKKSRKIKPKKSEEDKSTRMMWSERESLSLAKCWMHVSEDPTVSTNQRGDTFWYKVLGLFNEEWGHKNRNKDALTGKWEYIRSKVSKFNGIYSQLVQSNGGRPSGNSDNDVLTAALAEYRVVVGSEFPHLQCWEFLKDKQKFINPDPCVIGRRNKKRDAGLTREAPLDLDDEEGDNVAATFHSHEDRIPRPQGRPRPGKSQRTSSSSANNSSSSFYEGINEQLSELNTKKAESLAEKLESTLEIKRVQRYKQRNLDLELLRTNTDDYPAEAREMIEQQKARIMHNLATGFYEI